MSRYCLPRVLIALALLTGLFSQITSTLAAAGTTERISIDSAGAQANNQSSQPVLSDGGRIVAFQSNASNLVVGDTNGVSDIFVRDRQSGTTERVNVDSAGNQGTATSALPAISADGRFVAFESAASNLVPGDTNAKVDIFVRDRASGTTERVNVDSLGDQANNGSDAAAISADGRFVAFHSFASNLTPNDVNNTGDVFVRDRQTGTTERLTAGNGDSGSGHLALSADGRFVAFVSSATNLVSGDTNQRADVFVYNRQSGTIERTSISSAGGEASQHSSYPAISADGRLVAFLTDSPNLVAGDTNGMSDIFVRDRQSGTTERVSVDSAGVQANGTSGNPAISADGRLAIFQSDASNLIANDTNIKSDIFVRDRQSGTTERVSVDGSGYQANGGSFGAAIDPSGRFVAFVSSATNLVSRDTNSFADVFVHDLAPVLPAEPPSRPDLAAASDSGTSDTDNLTNDTTPTFIGTASPGLIVRVLVDGIERGSAPTADGSYSITTVPLEAGAHSITSLATNSAGNSSPISGALDIIIDTEPPTAMISASPPAITNSASVQFGFESEAGARFECSLTTGLDTFGACVSPQNYDLFADGAYTFKIRATDAAGNTGTAASYTFTIDTTSPTINISSPAGNSYVLGQAVTAAYSCSDADGSGLASCTGTMPDGSEIDSTSVGTQTFTVTAVDNAGNRTSQLVSYMVAYNICALYDQSKSHKLGSTVAIKLQLCDAGNTNRSSVDIVVHATNLNKLDGTASTDVDDSSGANPDNDFRYDATLGDGGGYIYNLSTKDLTTGTWMLSFTAAGDPTPHTVRFDVR